jgi:hypothetical protein
MRPLARTEDLLVEDVDGEVLVYDETDSLACRLNGSAAFVWRHCDGTNTVDDLVRLVAGEFGALGRPELVHVALDELAEHGLLASGYETRSKVAARLSRRHFMRAVGIGGAAAAVVPIVASMLVPTPAAASSLSSYLLAVHYYFTRG